VHTRTLQIALVMLLIGFFVACESGPEQTDNDLTAEASELFGTGSAGTTTHVDWTIVIAIARGDDQIDLARQALADVRVVPGLGAAYAERRGEEVTIIGFGRFTDPKSSEAQGELARVRAIEVNEQRPFATAYLIPPPNARGRIPEYDLRNVRKAHGRNAIYTLQIGAYGRGDLERPDAKDLAEFRKLAEEAVVRLRREGELAFYYHGPNMSNITIGIFGPADHDPQNPLAESIALRQARKRFPNNHLNGQGIRETVSTSSGKTQIMQTSRIVVIPES